MPTQTKAWACSFGCGRAVLTKKAAMVAHEARCFDNPIRRACQTCRHYYLDSETVYNPNHGGDPGSTDYERMIPYCGARTDVNLEKQLQFDCPAYQQETR